MPEKKPWRDRETVGLPEAAEILGKHPQTLRDAAERGEIEGAFRLGKNWTIPTRSLRHMLGEVTPA